MSYFLQDFPTPKATQARWKENATLLTLTIRTASHKRTRDDKRNASQFLFQLRRFQWVLSPTVEWAQQL